MSRLIDRQLVRESTRGDIARVREILERGAAVNRLHNDGFTALMRAGYYGHAQLVKLLLASGADPNHPGRDGAGALFWASVRGHEAIVELLLAAGADVNAVRGSEDRRRERNDGPT